MEILEKLNSKTSVGSSIEESEGPFPWSSVGCIRTRSVNQENRSSLPSWMASLPPSLLSNQGLQAIAFEAASMGCIHFRIPKDPNWSAGRVLQHCISVIQSLFSKHEPLTFKFGYSHNPCWRWENDLYGYRHAKEKWSDMVVLWVSDEASGPAMLEASLIEMFKSI